MSTGRLEMQTLLRLTQRKGKHPDFALFPAFWAAANADSRLPGAPRKDILQESVPLRYKANRGN